MHRMENVKFSVPLTLQILVGFIGQKVFLKQSSHEYDREQALFIAVIICHWWHKWVRGADGMILTMDNQSKK
jgi:hypothetical protein